MFQGSVRLKTILFNLAFYPLFVIVTVGMPAIFTIPIAMIWLLVGKRRALQIIRYLICWYGFIVVRILAFPFMRVTYKDYEKGKKLGACVYVCNHRSSSDGFFMALLNSEVIQVVNNWPFKIPIIGWVARIAGYLGIRKMPFEQFLKEGWGLLEQGVSLIAFPEGSRSTDRTVQQFNGAIFRVAQAARVPIVPLCLSGNQRIPEKGSSILIPGIVRFHKLPALQWESYKDLSPFILKNKVRAIIQSEVDKLESA